jgi:hypothetical protein
MSARSWTAGHPFDAGMTVPVFDRCLETVSQAHPLRTCSWDVRRREPRELELSRSPIGETFGARKRALLGSSLPDLRYRDARVTPGCVCVPGHGRRDEP